MSHPYKPVISGNAGTVTTGFRALPSDAAWDHQPIYKIVEVSRDAGGRLRREGHVWHNDLEMLRKFGRAVAANTSSHKVLITDSFGDIIEELPVAPPEARRSSWDTWGAAALPPVPPRPPRRVAAPPKPAVATPPVVPLDVPVVRAEASARPDPLTFPPRDIPKLPIAQADVGASAAAPAGVAADPGTGTGQDAEAAALAQAVPDTLP